MSPSSSFPSPSLSHFSVSPASVADETLWRAMQTFLTSSSSSPTSFLQTLGDLANQQSSSSNALALSVHAHFVALLTDDPSAYVNVLRVNATDLDRIGHALHTRDPSVFQHPGDSTNGMIPIVQVLLDLTERDGTTQNMEHCASVLSSTTVDKFLYGVFLECVKNDIDEALSAYDQCVGLNSMYARCRAAVVRRKHKKCINDNEYIDALKDALEMTPTRANPRLFIRTQHVMRIVHEFHTFASGMTDNVHSLTPDPAWYMAEHYYEVEKDVSKALYILQSPRCLADKRRVVAFMCGLTETIKKEEEVREFGWGFAQQNKETSSRYMIAASVTSVFEIEAVQQLFHLCTGNSNENKKIAQLDSWLLHIGIGTVIEHPSDHDHNNGVLDLILASLPRARQLITGQKYEILHDIFHALKHIRNKQKEEEQQQQQCAYLHTANLLSHYYYTYIYDAKYYRHDHQHQKTYPHTLRFETAIKSLLSRSAYSGNSKACLTLGNMIRKSQPSHAFNLFLQSSLSRDDATVNVNVDTARALCNAAIMRMCNIKGVPVDKSDAVMIFKRALSVQHMCTFTKRHVHLQFGCVLEVACHDHSGATVQYRRALPLMAAHVNLARISTQKEEGGEKGAFVNAMPFCRMACARGGGSGPVGVAYMNVNEADEDVEKWVKYLFVTWKWINEGPIRLGATAALTMAIVAVMKMVMKVEVTGVLLLSVVWMSASIVLGWRRF